MLPEDVQLPPPPNEYTEREIAQESNYRWTEWILLNPVVREQIMAWHLHRNMRSAYNQQEARKQPPSGKKKGGDPMNNILAAMGSKLVKKP